MDRFVSNFTLRLTSKGRVSNLVYRSVLVRDGFEGLYCYPALDRPAIDAGGSALMAEIEVLIGRYAPFSDQRERFALALYGTSETLKIDGEGRVVLSENLKRHAGIIETVAFVGLGHKFQIWEPGRFQNELAEATQKVRALKGEARVPGRRRACARSTGMMAGGGGSAVAGGPALHIPVLGRPAGDLLQPRQGGVYIDGTFGAGGYTRAILAAADCKVIGIDRDQTAIALGADMVDQADGRLTLIEDRFSNLDTIAREAGYPTVDGVVLDLGVSSMQLNLPVADSRSALMAPSTCGWAVKAQVRLTSSISRRARPRRYYFQPRRRAAFSVCRARHRQSARERPL